MGDLAATAEKLRQTRQATRDFLTLYALERVRARVQAQQQETDRFLSDDTAAQIEDEHDARQWAVLLRDAWLDEG